MKARTMIGMGFLSLMLAFSIPAIGSGGGGGGGGGGDGGGGAGSGSSSSEMGGPGSGPGYGMEGPGKGMEETGKQGREQMKSREQIQTREHQRARLMECTNAAQQVRARAREMNQAANRGQFQKQDAQKIQTQLRSAVQAMEQKHEDFLGTLSDRQRDRLQDRLKDMDRDRLRLKDCLATMDAELANPAPQRERIAEQSRLMETIMNQMENQYKSMEKEAMEP